MGSAEIGLFAFWAATTLAATTLVSIVTERRRVHKALRSLGPADSAVPDLMARELAEPLTMRVLLPGIARLGRFVRRFTPSGLTERLSKLLSYAGSPPRWDAERLLAMKLIATAALGLLGVLYGLSSDAGLMRGLTVVSLLSLGGYYLPELLLRSRAQKRQAEIGRALPDSLDLLSITVEAGLGFEAALERVAGRTGGPLGEELHRVVREMRLGEQRATALRNLSERSQVPELKSFVMAVVQAETFGISIGSVLKVQAHEMRVKRRQRAEERALKIPVKILFPLLFCILPALFVVLLGPAVIRISRALF